MCSYVSSDGNEIRTRFNILCEQRFITPSVFAVVRLNKISKNCSRLCDAIYIDTIVAGRFYYDKRTRCIKTQSVSLNYGFYLMMVLRLTTACVENNYRSGC